MVNEMTTWDRFTSAQKKYRFTDKRAKTWENRKIIICNETGIEYKSLTEASQLLNIPISTISRQIKGTLVTAKGLTFKFKTK